MASIYHYTSGSALLGIITNGEFWATDINFLNDHQEHVFGYEACLDYVKELKRKENDAAFGEWLKSLYQELIDSSRRNVIERQTYIVSFSKKSDSIAHWFSYCERNQGYCVEFEEDEFFAGDEVRIPSDLFMKFEDVNYADAESFSAGLGEVVSKDSIISRMLEAQKAASLSGIDLLDSNSQHADNFLRKLSSDLMLGLFSKIIISSCSYKGQGFLHESERRLLLLQKDISPIDEFGPSMMKFRERNGSIFPYTSIGFNKRSIKSILIGPCSDYEFKRSGLLKLLKSQGVECEVKPSSSSLRFT